MPYIKKEQRPTMNKIVDLMSAIGIEANGDLNYVLYAYCKYYIPITYNSYKNFCGELRQCATEIERRLLAPLEDEKITENGDV